MASGPSQRILLGCVAENNKKYLSQALRLVRSLRWFGGALKDADIVVAVVEGLEPAYRLALEGLGAWIRIVPQFDPANPLFNKIQLFRLPDLERYDTLFYLDCDTIVVQDPSPFLVSSALQAKIADVPTVPTEELERLCGHFGLKTPGRHYRTTLDQVPTVWYCNAGVVSCPVRFIPRIVPAWCEYELGFSANPDLLGPYQHHRSQAALALAFIGNPVPFEEMTVAMNFPLHLTHMETPVEMVETDPVILHYHQLVDAAGHLLPSPYPLAQKRIEAFNKRLRTVEQPGYTPGESERRDVPVDNVLTDRQAAKVVSMSGVDDHGRVECAVRDVIHELDYDLRDRSSISASAEPIVVCIAGMHRSGTSMFARMLHACGVYIGPERSLAEPAPDNEEGFWENPDFVNLNEALLLALGGSWDNPPSIPDTWDGAEMEVLRERGRELVRRLSAHGIWGWKDPRNSLTLPFWRQLVPGLKVVVCVRNPLEVIQSLVMRGASIDDPLLELWLAYNRRLMAAIPAEDRVTTHYSAYFRDPRAELRRVLHTLGVDASDAAIERASTTVSARLRHHQVATDELTDTGIPEEVIEEYLTMCSDAGPRLQSRAGLTGRSDGHRRDYRDVLRVMLLEAAIQKTELMLRKREAKLTSLKEVLASRDREIEELKARHEISLRNILKAVKRRMIK